MQLGLTTVTQPMVDMAVTAGQLLIRAIENPEEQLEPVIYPAKLVVRGSTAGHGG